jgi:putative membrane protein
MDLVVLLACLPGMLITMALLARGVRWLFRCHYAVAFHGILGIVLASAVMIIPMEYQGIAQAAACVAAVVFGAFLAYILAQLEDKARYVEK